MLTNTPAARAANDLTEASLKFFRDLAETRSYSLGQPMGVRPTPDGSAVLFLRSGPRDPVMHLLELDLKSGRMSEVLTPEAVLKGAEERLSVEELARRERMRMSMRGFTTFELSRDGARILLSLSGNLYVVRRADKRVTELPAGEGEAWIDPQFSPDGRFVAAVKGGELFVIDVETGVARQLTTGAGPTLTHGLAEFVAQEEMSRFHGFWWSPDSSQLVYQETDTSELELFHIAYPANPERAPESFPYPRPGKANAKVRLGLLSREGGATTWIDWDRERYPYLARVAWEERAPLTLLVQTRDQREEKLFAVDPGSGSTRELLTETDEAWVNLDTHQVPRWLADGSAFLWSTERRGAWQLELRGADGRLIREVTPLELGYNHLIDLDEKAGTIVVAGGPDPREQHLYRVPLKGGAPVRLTEEPGLHGAVFSRNHQIYAHTWSLLDGRSGVSIHRADGKKLGELPSVAEQPPFQPRLELTRTAGERSFDALLIRPRDFRPDRKYPVVLDVYGGPHHKVVRAMGRAYLKQQWVADHGYIVVSLDGRGTPGHGRAWERAIRGNLIEIPLEDQVAGLKALGGQYPELDLERVAVTGWSFGGYFSAMATIRRPDIFRVGVAGAPVTDWYDYDTHYTERYMGVPPDNAEGYRSASVLTWASQLERPLMLVHGLTDDNVYFLHTLKLVDALFKAGRPYDLVPLTGTHRIVDPEITLRLQARIMDYFATHLGEPLRYGRLSGGSRPAGSGK